MPSLQFTPGPLHLFAMVRGAGTPSYMGTCVAAPETEAEQFKIPVMNDLGGRSVPFQLVQDGENHLIMATMNRFDLAVLRSIRQIESGAGGALGQETGYARGVLTIGAFDWQLIILNGYAGNAAAGPGGAAAVLNVGRRYYSANLAKYKESTVGTRVLEVAMAIRCENVFVPATRGFALYSETDMAGATLGMVT